MTGIGGSSAFGLPSAALSPYLTGGAAGLNALTQAAGFNRQLAASRQVQAAIDAANTQANTTQANTNNAPAVNTQTTATSVRQQNQIAQLKADDQAVRAGIAAQLRAAGAYGGAVTYQYQRGPDGTNYAVAGDVSFNIQPVANNPAATIAAMQTIAKAAMSEVPPSAEDLAAAREADQYLAQAQAQLKAAQATTAAANTVLAAQQQSAAFGGATVTFGQGLAAYGTAATLGTPANQPGARLAATA